MKKLKTIGTALLLASVMAGSAYAQGATPIIGRDVVGEWTLRVIPAEQRGFTITVESDDGGRPDLDLTITARPGGALACVVGGDAADCEIDDGNLVVTSAKSGARMTFTLTDRARGGFVGTARMRARLLPFGTVHVGSVNMIRR